MSETLTKTPILTPAVSNTEWADVPSYVYISDWESLLEAAQKLRKELKNTSFDRGTCYWGVPNVGLYLVQDGDDGGYEAWGDRDNIHLQSPDFIISESSFTLQWDFKHIAEKVWITFHFDIQIGPSEKEPALKIDVDALEEVL